MNTPKALVVGHDEQTRKAIDEILSTLGHEYEMATSLAEAQKLLANGGHAYVIASGEFPARPGCAARAQNLYYLLEEMARIRGDKRVPVIVPFNPMTDVEDEDKLRWAADMKSRGATTFVQKPFRTRGRTLDRVIKKVLTGQSEPVKFVTIPLITMRKEDDPTVVGNIVPFGPLPPVPKPELPTKTETAQAPADLPKHPWPNIPNEPVDIDDFMATFCEPRSKENRMFRKRALLAAARHGTIDLPPLAAQRKHGQSNKYFTHDLAAAWQSYLDEGVDVPPLSGQSEDRVPHNNGHA